MFVRPKMGYVRAKIGLIGQFDRRQPGNYLQPCTLGSEGTVHFPIIVTKLVFYKSKVIATCSHK